MTFFMTKSLLIYVILSALLLYIHIGQRLGEMNYVIPEIPEIKTQGKKTFMCNGATLWNSLPNSLKLIEVKGNFKKKC